MGFNRTIGVLARHRPLVLSAVAVTHQSCPFVRKSRLVSTGSRGSAVAVAHRERPFLSERASVGSCESAVAVTHRGRPFLGKRVSVGSGGSGVAVTHRERPFLSERVSVGSGESAVAVTHWIRSFLREFRLVSTASWYSGVTVRHRRLLPSPGRGRLASASPNSVKRHGVRSPGGGNLDMRLPVVRRQSPGVVAT